MKKKEKTYLPLLWCRNLKRNMTGTFGCMINPEEILELTNTIQGETTEQSFEMVEKFCINADGEISVTDVIALQKYLHGKETLGFGNFLNADVNNDGSVNIFDLCLLKKQLVTKS